MGENVFENLGVSTPKLHSWIFVCDKLKPLFMSFLGQLSSSVFHLAVFFSWGKYGGKRDPKHFFGATAGRAGWCTRQQFNLQKVELLYAAALDGTARLPAQSKTCFCDHV